MVVAGECPGTLLTDERGTGGFGYDPLFVPRGKDRTFAEMPAEEKAALSHRGRAVAAAARPLARVLRNGADPSGAGSEDA